MKLTVPKKYIPKPGNTCIYILSGNEYCIINNGEEIYGIDNLCPHQSASLALGEIDGNEIVCPLHQYRFNFKSGECNISRFKIKTYRIEIE